MADRMEQMRQIKDEILHLETSPLYAYRTENNYYPVIGEGSHSANIMFIGEAPGKNEAQQGRPFCGASGRVLDQLLESIGLQRADVYITNVVKDRPPENRDPTPEEIALYTPFLVRQINIIQPRVIATLGRFAMDFVLDLFDIPEKGGKISKMRGQVLDAQAEYGAIHVVPLYHPAVALYNQSQRKTIEEDFAVLKEFVT
ncbi:MAG: uracil-DNA glycosylase [Chloroflexi bacterium]|nr:uracil-DNA glycosylase [Chloroflexota bacterium]